MTDNNDIIDDELDEEDSEDEEDLEYLYEDDEYIYYKPKSSTSEEHEYDDEGSFEDEVDDEFEDSEEDDDDEYLDDDDDDDDDDEPEDDEFDESDDEVDDEDDEDPDDERFDEDDDDLEEPDDENSGDEDEEEPDDESSDADDDEPEEPEDDEFDESDDEVDDDEDDEDPDDEPLDEDDDELEEPADENSGDENEEEPDDESSDADDDEPEDDEFDESDDEVDDDEDEQDLDDEPLDEDDDELEEPDDEDSADEHEEEPDDEPSDAEEEVGNEEVQEFDPEERVDKEGKKPESKEKAEPAEPADEKPETLADDGEPDGTKSPKPTEPVDSQDKPEQNSQDDAEVAMFAEGLSPEEAVEFLKLVELARQAPDEPAEDDGEREERFKQLAENAVIDAFVKPKKRFGLKKKGRGKPKKSPPEPSAPSDKTPDALQNLPVQSAAKPDKQARPGGNLRALEEALSAVTPGRIPGGLKKRAASTIHFLSKFEGLERALVVSVDDQGRFTAVAAAGFQSETPLQQTSTRLLKYTQLTKKSLMVIDCQKDNRFGRDPDIVRNNVRSVLCVPFTDFISKANGFLYADSTSKGDAFTYHDFQEAEKFATVLSTQADLGEYEYKAPQKEELQTELQPNSPWLPVVVVVASLLFLIPGVWNSMKPEPKPVETPELTTVQTSGPEAISLSYLRALGGGGTEAAYQLLAPETKEKLSLEEFQARAEKFLAGDQAFRLMRAEISSTEIGTTRAEILVTTASGKEPWKLTLVRFEGVWYVQSTKGIVPLKAQADYIS